MDAQTRTAWLLALDEGDEVLLTFATGRTDSICKVEFVTAKHLILEGDLLVLRATGEHRAMGQGYYRIEPVTQSHRDAIEHEQLGRWLTAFFGVMPIPPLSVLRAMRAAYDISMAAHTEAAAQPEVQP